MTKTSPNEELDRPDCKRAKIFKDVALIRKRAPLRPATTYSDIYVTKTSSYKGQLVRAKKLLLQDGRSSISIRAMGAAIERAVSLAMSISAACSNQVRCQTETYTVDLVDDVIPLDTEKDFDVNCRQNSAIHIRVELTQPMPRATISRDTRKRMKSNKRSLTHH
ncbi:ribonucleases P/MRP protein subunit pop7 [Lunasporangiospora selenospora]|uniref:Ribonucleases P/MRP protein subunit pop7 n=1 Tax=Lunasporangiospora selenospora TaxID=979761 RepID=A0A9P6G2G3_9FUNG|nr:ribonucleases P/MRP protein subunit pop7 [Lunasporangiospora selenospora]